MQKVMDAMGFAAVIVQGEAFCDANPAAAAITGYIRQELMGMRFWDTVHKQATTSSKTSTSPGQSPK